MRLQDALWAYWTAYRTPIGMSSYRLVYEKACHLPIKLEHRAYWATMFLNFDPQKGREGFYNSMRWMSLGTTRMKMPHSTGREPKHGTINI